MTDRISFTQVPAELAFSTPGAGVSAVLRDLTVHLEADRPTECTLEIEVTEDVYRRIDRDQLFHLVPDARGPGAVAFAPARSVRVSLRLATEHLDEALRLGSDARAIAQRLGAVPAEGIVSPLLDAASWYAVEVTADVEPPSDLADGAELRVGYRTSWADADV